MLPGNIFTDYFTVSALCILYITAKMALICIPTIPYTLLVVYIVIQMEKTIKQHSTLLRTTSIFSLFLNNVSITYMHLNLLIKNNVVLL